MKKKIICGSLIVIVVFLILSLISWPISVSKHVQGIGWNSEGESQKIVVQIEGTYYYNLILSDSFEGTIRIPYGPFRTVSNEQITGTVSFSVSEGKKHDSISWYSPSRRDGITTGHLWVNGIFDEFFVESGGYSVAAPASSMAEATRIEESFR